MKAQPASLLLQDVTVRHYTVLSFSIWNGETVDPCSARSQQVSRGWNPYERAW